MRTASAEGNQTPVEGVYHTVRDREERDMSQVRTAVLMLRMTSMRVIAVVGGALMLGGAAYWLNVIS